MNLSVVIPCYCNPDPVIRHLEACAKAQRKPDEVLVIDDGFPEGHLFARLWQLDWPFRMIYARILVDIPWNQPGARNLGLLLARGDAISFEDADHLPDPTYYAAAENELRSDGMVLVRAQRINPEGKRLKPSPGSWIVRRDAMLTVGGYDEDFSGHYGHDDYQALRRLARRYPGAMRILKDGFSIARDGAARGRLRDDARNRNLLKSKLKETVNHGPVLRFPWTVAIVKERKG